MSEVVQAAGIGFLIGFLPAVLSVVVSYLWFFRQNSKSLSGVLVFIFATSAILVLTGIVAIIAGFVSGELRNVLVTGVGVFFGFTLGFGLMVILYMRVIPSDYEQGASNSIAD